MKIQQTHLQNANLWNAVQYTASKRMAEVQQHSVNYAVEMTISEEGRQALKDKFSLKLEEEDVEFATVKNTNFVEFEQYMTLRELYVPTLAGTEHDTKDFMAALAEAYETRYNEIFEQHKNGDRQVTYEIFGECFVTLEEDLEGLNKAYERSLADMQGFIQIQQTNKAFANPDMEWWIRKHHPEWLESYHEHRAENKGEEQDDYNYFDEEYKKTAVSIMMQAREQFLSLFWGPNYQPGAVKDILSRIMNENDDFLEKTSKLFS